jgi:hypothetical protein
MSFNDQFQIAETQPTSDEARDAVASKCCIALQMAFPMLVDGIDDKVGNDYAAFPDRLYLIDSAGRVAYKGGRGPFGYDPLELEQALLLLLLDEQRQPPAAAASP